MKDITIRKMGEECVAEASAAMSEAFLTESFTKKLVRVSLKSALPSVNIAFRLRMLSVINSGIPLVAACKGDTLTGAAMITSAKAGRVPFHRSARMLAAFIYHLCRGFYCLRLSRIPGLIRMAWEPPDIPDDRMMLELIAVRPEYQGHGIGKRLLEAVRSTCVERNASGVYLFTSDMKNRLLYERNGYRVIRTVENNGLAVYHMFLPEGRI